MNGIMAPDGHHNNALHWQELEAWRKKIDALDQELTALLCERLECARHIIALKSDIGEAVLQPEREKEVLANVLGKAGHELTHKALGNIYKCILEESRLFQQECKKKTGQGDSN